MTATTNPPDAQAHAEVTAFATIGAISLAHLLNDMMQSLLPAIYPVLKESFSLDFTQIGIITLAFNITASLLQPAVGLYTDRHPKPFSLTIGMGLTLCGLLALASAPTYPLLVAGRKLDDVLPPAWRDACAQLAERVRAEPQILHQVTLETGTLRLTPIESFDPPRHLLVFEPR